jgi:hypothetical protein
MRIAAGFFVCAIVAVPVLPAPQSIGSVKVTVARANVRAEPSDKAPVVTQVTSGTILELKAIEGDWFKVQVPNTGALRIDAYISRKVSKVEKLDTGAGAATPPAGVASTGPPADATGIAVAWQLADGATWLTSTEAKVAQLAQRPNTLKAMAAELPAELHAPIAAGSSQVSYVWTIPADAVTRTVDEKRPAFLIDVKGVPKLNPDDLTPALVRLTAAPSGVRLVAMARGRADEISRTTPEWEVMRDLRQDVVRATVEVLERGLARLQPVADLEPGDYAVVVRPPRTRLAGATVLSRDGEGRLFSAVWAFAVR